MHPTARCGDQQQLTQRGICPRAAQRLDLQVSQLIVFINHTDMTLTANLILCRISYCSADATFDRVVAFIATNKNETLECHAFLTAKRKVAQAAALTISQAFTIAFERWKAAKAEKAKKSGGKANSENVQQNGNSKEPDEPPPLIDLSTDPTPDQPVNGFDDEAWLEVDDGFSR